MRHRTSVPPLEHSILSPGFLAAFRVRELMVCRPTAGFAITYGFQLAAQRAG